MPNLFIDPAFNSYLDIDRDMMDSVDNPYNLLGYDYRDTNKRGKRMKKFKKACGKGGAGIKHLSSAAIKTVIGASLSQNEKATLHHLQGRDQASPEIAPIVFKETLPQQERVLVVNQILFAAAAENLPSFEEVVGANEEPNE